MQTSNQANNNLDARLDYLSIRSIRSSSLYANSEKKRGAIEDDDIYCKVAKKSETRLYHQDCQSNSNNKSLPANFSHQFKSQYNPSNKILPQSPKEFNLVPKMSSNAIAYADDVVTNIVSRKKNIPRNS